MASGWMRGRQRARQRNVELPLIISDHADWDELTDTIREVAPSETWITHGREEALLHWCMTHQMRARALALIGREDEVEGRSEEYTAELQSLMRSSYAVFCLKNQNSQ